MGVLDGKTVLIVDDELDIVELLEFVIAGAGATVRRATSAREALKLLPSCKPDVMLLDIGMPDMDGYELLSVIRSDPALEKVPAVAVTGYGYEKDKKRAFSEGFAVHVTKPFKSEVLVDLVKWISRKKPHAIC